MVKDEWEAVFGIPDAVPFPHRPGYHRVNLDPATATNIVNNPMPVMRTATEFRRAANSSLTALQDPDYRGQPIHNWAKNIPIVRQIPKTDWLGNNLYENRSQ